MLESSSTYKVKYFQPNQFALFLSQQTGGMDVNFEELADLLKKKSLAIIQQYNGYKTAQLSKANTYNLDPVPGMNECYVSKLSQSRSPMVTPRGKSHIVFFNVDVDNSDGEYNPATFFRMLTGLEEQLRNEPIGSGATLEAVSPNWLVRSVSEGSGTGGPGAWPVPYRGAPELAPYQIRNIRVKNRMLDDLILWIRAFLAETFGSSWPQIQTVRNIVEGTSKGENVNVIILDTMPPVLVTQRAYRQYKDKHPLINSLLAPDGMMGQGGLDGTLTAYPLDTLGPNGLAAKTAIDGMTAIAHDYDMSDHGLFVAGVIHTIAPLAKIHLIEVLNCNGVGNSDSITAGLDKAIDLIKSKPNESFVVNCSFTVDLPLEPLHLLTKVFEDLGIDFFTRTDKELEVEILKKIEKSAWLTSQETSLQHMCDIIYSYDSRVIAAAGNDRVKAEEEAPQARMPAALASVQGVGALPRTPVRLQNGRRSTASYSNLSDTPTRVGIAALGGEAGEGQGVLGIYLGRFPGGEENNTNWAWWPGTSFATPIVSGITAITMSTSTGTPGRQGAQQAIDNLYNSQKIIEESRAEGGADILDIVQG